MKTLALLQVLAAGIAALLAYRSVETILGSCPVLAASGFVLALVCASRRQSVMLAFALSAPLVTAIIAAIISIGDLRPNEAAAPVGITLACYFVGTLVCLWPVLDRSRSRSSVVPKRESVWTQFSLRAILILTTVLAVLFGLARGLNWRHEMLMFGAYACTMIAAATAIATAYAKPIQRRTLLDVTAGLPLDASSPPAGADEQA